MLNVIIACLFISLGMVNHTIFTSLYFQASFQTVYDNFYITKHKFSMYRAVSEPCIHVCNGCPCYSTNDHGTKNVSIYSYNHEIHSKVVLLMQVRLI